MTFNGSPTIDSSPSSQVIRFNGTEIRFQPVCKLIFIFDGDCVVAVLLTHVVFMLPEVSTVRVLMVYSVLVVRGLR